MARTKKPIRLANRVSEWTGNNYGGPDLICKLCGHWPLHTTLDFRDGKDGVRNRTCNVHPRGKTPVTPNTKSCIMFNYQLADKFFHCKKTANGVTLEVCAYRYFNETHERCAKCDIGAAAVDYMYWLEKDVPTQDEVKGRNNQRGTTP